MTQREDPAHTLEEFEALTGVRPELLGGGRIHSFREGWALPIGNFGRAHYFRRYQANDFATALCGYKVEVRRLYGEGNWDRCQRCISKRGRR